MSAEARGPTGIVVRDCMDLQVWQKGMEPAQDVYQLTRDFPSDEKYGLVSQMRRAAVSVPSNLAEGQARNTTGELVQVISLAEGSLAELDTQLQLAVAPGFFRPSDAKAVGSHGIEIQKMLKGLRRKLNTNH
jgi:four helix bundle protein